MLPLVGLLHALIVVALFLAALRSSDLDPVTKLNAIVVAVWTDLVLTGLITSAISALDRPLVFAGTSIVLAIAFMPLLARLGRPPLAAPQPIPSILDYEGFLPGALLTFVLVTGALVLAANILLAVSYLPNNPDTVTYRLPRIYWYLGAEKLGHFASGIDPRAVYYPFNGTLLQMPIALYRWSARLFNAVPLAAWCLVGATTFRIAREVGFSRKAGVVAAWLVCLTPGVLVQAVSTNDEIIAAFILLIGAHFAIRFWRSDRMADAAFALLAISLSIGTKLHFAFFWPMLMAWLVLIGFWLATGRPFAGRSLISFSGVRRLAPIAVVCAALILPFAGLNWWATGNVLLPPDWSSNVVNRPFRIDAGLENLVLHATQTVLSPVPDLNPSGDDEARRAFYHDYNGWFSGLFTWVNQGPEFMSVSYRFNGPTGTVAWFRNENSVDIGFSYLLIGAALLICARRSGAFRVGLAASGAFVVWFVTYCFTSRYIEGFSVYLAYAFIVCAPAIPFALARTRRPAMFIGTLLAFVVTTHALAAWNILRTNVSRNVPAALMAQAWPVNPPPVDDSIVQAVRQHGGAQFQATHWEIPYWDIMALDKGGRYFVDHPSRPNPGRLNLYSFQKVTAYGSVPIQVLGKASPGLVLIGSFNSDYGPEWAFASGGGVERDRRHPGDYIALQVSEDTNYGQTVAGEYAISAEVAGLSAQDGLQFRYTLRGADGAEIVADWGGAGRRLAKPGGRSGGTLIVEVRPESQPGLVTRLEYPLQTSEPFALRPAPASTGASQVLETSP